MRCRDYLGLRLEKGFRIEKCNPGHSAAISGWFSLCIDEGDTHMNLDQLPIKLAAQQLRVVF